jgi:hypothetical protein
MPFTLSHIAAVLPMQSGTRTGVGERTGPFIASALVFGSMAPDAVLFFDLSLGPLHITRDETHSAVPGVLLIDLALTATAVAVWHLLLLRPLLALLPDGVRAKLEGPLLPRPPRRAELPGLAGWFIVSSWLGSLTHIFWDAWTHHSDPGVAHVAPFLRDQAAFGRPWFVLLQYASTVVGGLAMLWWARRRYAALPAHPVTPGLPAAVRATVLGVLGLAGLLGAARATHPFLGQPAEVVIFYLTTGFGRGCAYALVVYGLAHAVWQRGRVAA